MSKESMIISLLITIILALGIIYLVTQEIESEKQMTPKQLKEKICNDWGRTPYYCYTDEIPSFLEREK